MIPFSVKLLLTFLLYCAALLGVSRATPNVIVIFLDDLGWLDAGPAWSSSLVAPGLAVPQTTDLLTPTLDTLAGNGIRFSNGYVTCPVCSPSRAGLMTGRYQQRFGYEINPGQLLERNPVFGLPLTESTLGDRMKALGYATGWIGKSHLGALDQFHPVKRGFDEFFGFLEGHHHYNGNTFPPGNPPPWAADPIQRAVAAPFTPLNPLRVSEGAYLTEAFGREIVAYIEAHHTQPFFIYAPFNSVHEPMEVPDNFLLETTALFPGDPVTMAGGPSQRHIMAAMLRAVDAEIGKIMLKLTEHGLLNDTLIIVSSDNGAPPSTRLDVNGSTSLPLRGNKSDLYEGGIRVPFIVHWPTEFGSTGRVVHAPVSTLDILPTCVAAAGGTIPAAWQLDGVNLLPYLRGETLQEPHAALFWRVESGVSEPTIRGPRAVRHGNWKLIQRDWSANWELYDLSTHDGLRETANLADAHPEKVRELLPLYEAWEATLPRPRWDYNTVNYTTPTFVLEDLPVSAAGAAVLAPEFFGNAYAWQDGAGVLWQGALDLATGLPVGVPAQVDTNLAALSANNEGPQWGVSANGAALFYAKPGTASHLQLWRGGAELTTHATLDSTGPRVSQEASSAVVGIIFNRGADVLAAADNAPASVVALPNPGPTARNGRWIPGTGDIVFVNNTNQLVRYNPQTAASVTLTDDLDLKRDAWAFIAPEFDNELCYACVVADTGIAIYRDLHRGGGLLDRVATLAVPATETARFLFQMKPLQGARGFNGVSWFSCAAYQNPDVGNPGASAIWLLGLGPDTPTHRLPRTPPVTTPDYLCREWKSYALRVSDPAASGVASEPETVVGEHEVFCFYTRTPAGGTAQLRRARTGLVKPDTAPTGFASLEFSSAIVIGENDPTGQRKGGTETTALIAHDGKLFAAMSSRGDSRILNPLTWAGTQFLVKDSAVTPWRLDHSGALTDLFRDHRAVEALVELTFTRNGTAPLGAPVKHLVAGLSDIGETGSHIASARTRLGPGNWVHSTVVETPPSAEPAHAMSFAVHLDRDTNNDGIDDALPEEFVFSGLSNGEIYRGTYDPNNNTVRLVWNAADADLPQTPIFKLGPVTGLADANGTLYAACGVRQDLPADFVTGGIYKRDDHTDTWTCIYAWPNPLPVTTAPAQHRTGTSFTAVPDPRGCGHEVLLVARSWPGVVELIDPERDHAVTVELDVRDFFARSWSDDSVRAQDVSVGYTAFTPMIDPVTGQRVHLLGVWLQHPALPADAAAHFLIRHADGTWENASIPGPSLRAPQCFAASPFAADAGLALYVGGYDAGDGPAHETAWIKRGAWTEFPRLTIASPAAQTYELAWPFTTLDWALETSTDLATWLPVPGNPTRSLTGTSLQTIWPDPKRFFRLRRP